MKPEICVLVALVVDEEEEEVVVDEEEGEVVDEDEEEVYLQGVQGKNKTPFLVNANRFENFFRLHLLSCLKCSTGNRNILSVK